MANYIADNHDIGKLPKSDVDTYKAVIPEVGRQLRKWQKVNGDNFSTHLYLAHREFTCTLANFF